MIDTVRLAYPADSRLMALFDSFAERLQKISADGEVIWERSFCHEALPSSFSGLRVTLQMGSDLKKEGFTHARSLVFFEFSLQKWQSDTGYNHENTSLADDLLALDGWVGLLSYQLDYDFWPENFEVYRVDLSQNYILENGSVPDFLRSLELKFSRHENGEKKLMRFDGALQYGSRWIGKKLYHKFGEFQKNYFKGKSALYGLYNSGVSMDEIKKQNGGKRILNETEITSLTRMLRFEVEFRRMYLQRNKIIKFKALPQLLERFEKEKETFLSVKAVPSEVSFTDGEHRVFQLVKVHGLVKAQQIYLETKSRASWFRIKSSLLAKGVRLESFVNDKWRLDEKEQGQLKEFRLRVA